MPRCQYLMRAFLDEKNSHLLRPLDRGSFLFTSQHQGLQSSMNGHMRWKMIASPIVPSWKIVLTMKGLMRGEDALGTGA